MINYNILNEFVEKLKGLGITPEDISKAANKKLYTTNINLSIEPDTGDNYIIEIGDNVGFLRRIKIQLSVTTNFEPDSIEDITDFNSFITSIGDNSGDTDTIFKGSIQIGVSDTETGNIRYKNVPCDIYKLGDEEYLSYRFYYTALENSLFNVYNNNTDDSLTYTVDNVVTFEV